MTLLGQKLFNGLMDGESPQKSSRETVRSREPTREGTPPRPKESDRGILCVPTMIEAEGQVLLKVADPSRR
jgi:hypothetical protein